VNGNRFKLVLTGLLLIATLFTENVSAKNFWAGAESQGDIALSELPLQGQQTHRLIYQGGPFPFDKDGVVFGNRERLLPLQKRGYYREYTVPTPGARDRGAKRIVCGGTATLPNACFYSADHYASFRKIVP
jgi:ribonuclease T1